MGEAGLPPWIDNYETFGDRRAVVLPHMGITSGNDGDVTLSCITYEILKNHPKPYCIDVGCAGGWWTAFVRMINPRAEIIAFEPNPESYDKLQERFQDASGLLILPYAVSGSHGTLTLMLNGEQSNSRPMMIDDAEARMVEVNRVTLHPFLRSRVDFLKIDVEGHEPAILYSLRSKFDKIHTIVFEYSPHWIDNGGELLEFMAEHYPYIAHLSRRHTISLTPLRTKEERQAFHAYCLENKFQTDILVSKTELLASH
jgi:FkbM family methyltransferase